jgi:hypothetical protein
MINGNNATIIRNATLNPNQKTQFTNIVIPNTVTINNKTFTVTNIEDLTFEPLKKGVFNGFTNLTSITIPDSVTKIGEQSFFNCKALFKINEKNNLPSYLTSIQQGAFSLCKELTSIIIPANVTLIDMSAFSQCSKLKEIKFLKTTATPMLSFGLQAFSGISTIPTVYYYKNANNNTLKNELTKVMPNANFIEL